jgi:hypothetical protein
MFCELAIFFHIPSMGGRSFIASALKPNFECVSTSNPHSGPCKTTERYNLSILTNYTFIANKKLYIEYESIQDIGKPLDIIEKTIRPTYESFGCKLWTLALFRHPYRHIQASFHHFGEQKNITITEYANIKVEQLHIMYKSIHHRFDWVGITDKWNQSITSIGKLLNKTIIYMYISDNKKIPYRDFNLKDLKDVDTYYELVSFYGHYLSIAEGIDRNSSPFIPLVGTGHKMRVE